MLLVTIPLSIHAAVMLLGREHRLWSGLDMMFALTVALGALTIVGAALTAHAVREYRRASRCIRDLREGLQSSIAVADSWRSASPSRDAPNDERITTKQMTPADLERVGS